MQDVVRLFDAKSLAQLAELELDRDESAIDVAGLGDGRFALVTGDGRCVIVEPTKQDRSQFGIGSVLPIRDVHLVTVDWSNDSLLVAHHIDQIDVLDCESLAVKRQIRPNLSRWRLVDRYIMAPLRMIVPQTGELGETIASLISGKSGVAIPGGVDEGEVVRYDIFRPVVSCSTFIVAMLTVACVYFSTRDF